MKKALLTGAVLLFCHAIYAQMNIGNTPNITKISNTKIIVKDDAIVPPKQVLYIHNAEGKLIKTYLPSDKVAFGILSDLFDKLNPKPKKPTTSQNCFKVSCPSGAPEGSTCWDCKPAKQ